MAINRKRKVWYWYNIETQGRHVTYTWNSLISWLRLAMILGGVALCLANQVLAGSLVLIAYFGLYFTYLKVNHDVLLAIQLKDQVEQISGKRYSFGDPLRIRFNGRPVHVIAPRPKRRPEKA